MPINIPNDLPAAKTLTEENIFVMYEDRATSQDIRPLNIAILNLMPTKIVTETQILRLLGNSPLQVNITLLHPKSHASKNTPREHLIRFYNTFDEISHLKFDGLIVTGAPVELLEYHQVDYWEELKQILDWSKTNVFSSFFICWGAQAALYHFYGIGKTKLSQKQFGIFNHRITEKNHKLLRGFDHEFYVPHSRHTEIIEDDLLKTDRLKVLSRSDEAGVYIIADRGGKQFFVMGHSEYDSDTLKKEYERDLGRNLNVPVPHNYFPDDDPEREPRLKWRAHANLLYVNWLNYFVYQETPYDLEKI